jgi:hypothetical protein
MTKLLSIIILTSLLIASVHSEEKVVAIAWHGISIKTELDSLYRDYLSKGWTVKHVAGSNNNVFIFVFERPDRADKLPDFQSSSFKSVMDFRFRIIMIEQMLTALKKVSTTTSEQ